MTETEALKELGLPKSPVIDLAICTVAELLKPLDAQSPLDQRCTLITRYRAASRTVREALSIEDGIGFYRVMLNIDVGDEASRITGHPHTDWLGQAQMALEAIGVDTGPNAKRMATRYGWSTQHI